jgi:hypothetical protein
MANEYRKRKRVKNIQSFFEQKQRFEIEAKVRQTIEHRADWWDNFNIELYVKYLESK